MSFVPANTSHSAAHLVLSVPALVDAIVKNVAVWKMIPLATFARTDEISRQLLAGNARRDVLSLRSVGKVFREATLNELWHTQTSLLGLLNVIGVLEPKDQSDNEFWEYHARGLTRSLTLEDVRKLLPYSTRIKTFYISLDLPEVLLKESDIQQVIQAGAVLFPNLRVMSGFYLADDLTEISFIMRTMGEEALSQLVLHEYSTSFPTQLVEFARGKATGLKLLSLGNDRTSGRWESPDSAILSVLRDATNLVVLNLNILADEEVLSLVVRMPRLVRLCIRVSSGDSFSFPTAPYTLPALSELELHMASLPAGSRLLQHSSFPCLKKLVFLFLQDGTTEAHPGDVQTFMKAVVTATSVNTLEALIIKCPVSRWRLFPEQGYITGEDLAPLLRCSGMRSCSLRAGWHWDLDDAFLQDMAFAWPKIKHLYLDPSNRWRGGTSRITLNGLEALALHCPELVAFGAVIDGEMPLPTLPDILAFTTPLDGKWHEALRTLSVGKSPIVEPNTVSVFLSARFPNLTTIDTFFPASQDKHAKLWAKVAELVPALAVVRIQERKRARLISQDTDSMNAADLL